MNPVHTWVTTVYPLLYSTHVYPERPAAATTVTIKAAKHSIHALVTYNRLKTTIGLLYN